ncbi:hypothetical protein [Mesorhizobium sp. CO1-1-9]|uniref:hypothetical protein n=1 Tax=Mesorhizobium sp. CO1-1-9 TaxID=2876630 RepID=UPI001CCC5254|nr:hypothetical protein [Mesorhizobium sp. CO1-1-9]MBZ9694890.1 hypothetical protein [Mesorhizobium sp. CO1-1-9]
MKTVRKYLQSASGPVARSVVTMVVCFGIGGVLFALKPGLASSVRETLGISKNWHVSSFDGAAESDQSQSGSQQVVPGVSPVFLGKLSAITESASISDKKLSDIDSLVRSYGWPSTPPAIAQAVAAARIKVLADKATRTTNDDAQAENSEDDDNDFSRKPEEEQLQTFIAYTSKFYVAQYCSDNGAFFTPDDIERLKLWYQNLFSTMTLSQEKRDAVWRNAQAIGPTRLAGMTAEECAAERQSYLFISSEIFAPSDPIDNPF